MTFQVDPESGEITMLQRVKPDPSNRDPVRWFLRTFSRGWRWTRLEESVTERIDSTTGEVLTRSRLHLEWVYEDVRATLTCDLARTHFHAGLVSIYTSPPKAWPIAKEGLYQNRPVAPWRLLGHEPLWGLPISAKPLRTVPRVFTRVGAGSSPDEPDHSYEIQLEIDRAIARILQEQSHG